MTFENSAAFAGSLSNVIKLVGKYSDEQLIHIANSIDFEKLVNDMRTHGATGEEVRELYQTCVNIMDIIAVNDPSIKSIELEPDDGTEDGISW